MKFKALALTCVFIIAVILSLYCFLQFRNEDLAADIVLETAKTPTKTPGLISGVNRQSGLPVEPGNTQAEAGSPIMIPETEGIVPAGHIHASVAKIVDGDTVKIEYKDKEYRVRLLCIDTPESVKEGVAVQPYGKEASEKLSETVLNRAVTLVFEKDIEDKYGRLLAYVILKDGSCVNALMVEQGFARIDMVKPNTVYRDYFDKLQRNAIREKRGLWSLPPKERPFVEKDEGYYVPRYFDDAA